MRRSVCSNPDCLDQRLTYTERGSTTAETPRESSEACAECAEIEDGMDADEARRYRSEA